MSRLAWFTPLPPSHSGIAAYSAEILPLLAREHAIDTFIDPALFDGSTTAASVADLGIRVCPSRDFVWRHDNQPYDLIVYQLGNASCHDYMWPYLVRFPGLVVLHDAQLHQARSKALLTSRRADDYREEFAFCHPDANQGIAEIVVAALGGSLFFLWPLIRVPIESSRLVAVHTPWLAATLGEQYPSQAFRTVEMGVADPLRPSNGAVADVRARHGIAPEHVVFAAFGMLTPEKRLREILRALRNILLQAPEAHLLLVGQPAEFYDVEADARAMGVADRVTITGYVSDDELPSYLAAADVCLCLRWPTSRETSASWLRCLAAGKPTVITELLHTTSVPALDPRSWTAADGSEAPVCVAIDIIDEQHSLGLAMQRLVRDGVLRRELGQRAREYWRRHHTLERMAESYGRVIEDALARSAPDRSHLPPHLLADGTTLTETIVGEFGLSLGALDW